MSARELPTGTITFLFTDIEGSTRILGQVGDRYPEILEQHQRLLRDAFAAHGGIELGTEGDSFFVVFERAGGAAAAAVAGQRALAEHDWPEDAVIRVRMGLHTGEANLGADNYVGIDVNRASRIAAAGHGGQILVSETTRSLVAQSLPEGVGIRDLGEHRLKDLAQPERLAHLEIPGLPSDFPPIRSLDTRRTNLPHQLTSFVGRERELAEVKDRVGRSRLITLTGPGGTGKTRIAIQAGAELIDDFRDGAFFVSLASLTDPDGLAPAIGEAIGLHEDPGRPAIDQLLDRLRDAEMLLILDNFEQVLAAADTVGRILERSEHVRVLATSREALSLLGEQELSIPPMTLPDPSHLPPPEQLSRFEAVRLFIERASAVRPGFEVTNENAPAVAELCARLDGLPLAIELAAARVKLLAPERLLERLEHRLSLTAGKTRNLPGRQQTLRGTIAWSYDLLDEEEQALFRRLSVFVGGFALEPADAVANPGGELGIDTLDGVASLANKSLLRQMTLGAAQDRFLMLGTVREYAEEELDRSPDALDIRRRHAEHFLALAQRAAPELTGIEGAHWLDTLSEEHGNFRAILTDPECALELRAQLAASLWRFWHMRGHLREAEERFAALLPQLEGVDPAARADAWESAGNIAYWKGDWSTTVARYQRNLEIRREMGDPVPLGRALYNASFTYLFAAEVRDIDRAMSMIDESIEVFEKAGDEVGTLDARWFRGFLLYDLVRGDEVDGHDLESVRQAMSVFEEAIERGRERKDRFRTGWSLHGMGLCLQRLGDLDGAAEAYRESLEIFAESRDLSAYVLLLDDLWSLALDRGDRDRAARLAGAFVALRETTGTELVNYTHEREGRAANLERLLADEGAAAIFAEGKGLSAEDAVTYALEA